jgi:hypothetical protein
MAGKKHYKQINIDVEPFLSIMAIVLKLVSLILVVIVMRIAVNAEGKKIVMLGDDTWHSKTTAKEAKEPQYIDCYQDRVVMYPSLLTNTLESLQQPDNDVEKMLDAVEKNAVKEYVVVLARPDSVKVFRAIRKMIGEHKIDVGYDVLRADYKVDWDKAKQALAVAK